MTTLFCVRALHSTRNDRLFLKAVNVFGDHEGEAKTQAEQIWLTREQVAELLAARELEHSDLVVEQGAWTTLGNSLEFSEVAAPSLRRDRWRQRIAATLTTLMLGAMTAFWWASMWHVGGRR